jgi:cytochrome c
MTLPRMVTKHFARNPAVRANGTSHAGPSARARRTGLVATLAMGAVLAANAAWAADPQSLLVQYKCTICHAEREALAGPPLTEIAAGYRGQRDAAALMATRIRSGMRSGGPWHMPPHPELSESDAMAIAAYILSLPQ